jgi:transcription antitermination factor NusG
LATQNQITQLTFTGIAPGEDKPSWFAIQTRPKYEKKVVSDLQEKGIDVFLPTYSSKRQWSDRQKVVHSPVFPGYVFVRLVPVAGNRVPILRTNGVTGFVGARGVGTSIPDSEMESLQTVIRQEIAFEPYPYLKIGGRVCIRGGSLDGIVGMLTAINGDQSLVVSVDLIHKSIAIRIAGYSVEAT